MGKEKSMKKLMTIFVSAMVLVILVSNSANVFAAGKSIEAFKLNYYPGTNDCQTMISGIKGYDSAYSSYYSASSISQADLTNKTRCIKYWSSHGNNYGELWGNNYNCPTVSVMGINNFKWSGSNLEFIFFAACRQLDGLGSNPRAKYANAMIGNNAVRVICGYHEDAPAGGSDVTVVSNFLQKAKTGESVKSSWIQANQMVDNYYYCVLTHSGNVQYSRFPGFPGLTYSRPGSSSTTILRFSSAKPNGTNQPLKSGSPSLGALIQECEIPNYSLKAIDTDIYVNSDIKTTVLKLGTYLTTQNNEIGDKEVCISEEKAVSITKEWLKDVYSGVEWNDFKDAELLVTPIVMAEVDLDGNVENEKETVIAYDISLRSTFNGIPIYDDKYCTIVDDTGVVSSAVSHRNYEVVKNEKSKDMMDKEIIEKKLLSAGVDLNDVEKCSIAFMDDDGDGILDPVLSVRTTDCKTAQLNLINDKIFIY